MLLICDLVAAVTALFIGLVGEGFSSAGAITYYLLPADGTLFFAEGTLFADGFLLTGCCSTDASDYLL